MRNNEGSKSLPTPVRVPEEFKWKKKFLRHRWKLIREDGETVATISFSWINAFKGGGTYDGKRFEAFERGKPDWGTYLKRQDDSDYWGKFEWDLGGSTVSFVLRNLKQYKIVMSSHWTFDLFDPYGEILATTRFRITALRRSHFTLLRWDPKDPEPSLLAVVSLIAAYQYAVGELAAAFAAGAGGAGMGV